jgi:predicted dehydrogenase
MHDGELKSAIIGLGLLGMQHLVSLQEMSEIVSISVCDISETALKRASMYQKVKSFYTNVDQMIKEEMIDVLIVATPDNLHYKPIIAGIEKGIPHIVTEKPLTQNLEESVKIHEAAGKHGTNLYVLFANRFNSNDMMIKYCLQRGLIGQVLTGESKLDDSILVPKNLWGKRSSIWAEQSSPAHFLMSHSIDLLRWYFSPFEIEKVFASSDNRLLKKAPEFFDAQLFWNNGMIIRLKSEWVRYMDNLVEFHMSFSGMKGSLVYNKTPGYKCQAGIQINISQEISEEVVHSSYDDLQKLGHSVVLVKKDAENVSSYALEYENPNVAQQWQQALSYFISDILGTQKASIYKKSYGPLPDGNDGLMAVKVVSAIEESARTDTIVHI